MGLDVILLINFDWTTPEATKPLWKSPKNRLIHLKKLCEMLALSIEEIQPNCFLQIGDNFNSKNFWFYTPTQ